MMEDNTEDGFTAVKLEIPESSEWECEIAHGFSIIPIKGNEPNLFHRWMQRLCFGFKWSKK